MKKAALVLVSLMMILAFMGTASPAAPAPVSVTDMGGRRVEAPHKPQRILCLGPGCLRLISYLGAVDKVVGVEEFERQRPAGRPYRFANPGLAKLPVVGPGGPAAINKDPDLEAVLRVKPELIFITYMEPARAEALQQKLGIPVVLLSYGRFATFDPVVCDSLDLAGKILGRESRADRIRAYIDQTREDLRRRTADLPEDQKPWVYVGGVGYKGAHGLASSEPHYIPLEWVGARNLAQKVSQREHVFIDEEQILAWNPAIIFLDAVGLQLVAGVYQKDPRFFEGLQAFQQERVYLLLPFNYYMTNIGTALADAYAVGKILYPEKFADVDLAQRADEIYTFLVGKPVYEHMVENFGKLGQVVHLGPQPAD